jgi:hypothetical protein
MCNVKLQQGYSANCTVFTVQLHIFEGRRRFGRPKLKNVAYCRILGACVCVCVCVFVNVMRMIEYQLADCMSE